jgi:DNA-binding transcriptional LysR family regulator
MISSGLKFLRPILQLLCQSRIELKLRATFRGSDHSRKLELTPAAQRLAADAATALHCVAVSIDASRAISAGKAGLIRVAFTPASLAAHAGEALKALRAEAPDLRFELFEMPSNDQVDALRDGRIDAGFLHPPIEADLDFLALPDEPMSAVLGAAHAPVDAGPIELSALQHTPLILFPRSRGSVLYDRIISACHAAGFTPRLAESVLGWPAAMTLAALGFGATLAPQSLAQTPPAGAVALPLIGAGLTLPHALATSRRQRVAAETRLIEITRAMARSG